MCTHVQSAYKCAKGSYVRLSQGAVRSEITPAVTGRHLSMEHPSTWLTSSLAELVSLSHWNIQGLCVRPSPTLGKVRKESCSPVAAAPSSEPGTEQLLFGPPRFKDLQRLPHPQTPPLLQAALRGALLRGVWAPGRYSRT